MRSLAKFAASLCVVTGLGIIGYAILTPDAPATTDPIGCPDGLAPAIGASGRTVCVRGMLLSDGADPKCPDGHVAMAGVPGRTICMPGMESVPDRSS